jgi:hypothetical protein
LVLHLVALFGLVLRVAAHHGRAFEGDELSTLVYIERDYRYLLTHFESNLTMNWYTALLKGVGDLFGHGPWALVLPSLVGGVASIYLLHALAARLLGAGNAHLAALLLACCPTFVDSSTELRSYALFNVFALASFVLALAWLDTRRWRTGALCALAAALGLLMHPNALYPLCAVGVWVGLELWKDRRGWAALLVPTAAAALVVLAAYAPLRAGMQAYRLEWTVPPPAEWDYLPELARRYFGEGWLAVPALSCAGFGLWSALRERAPAARLGLGLLVPLCVTSLLGVATLRGAYARFLSPLLPILLLLVVHGADVLGRRWRAARLAALLAVLACWIPQFVTLAEGRAGARYPELFAALARRPEPGELFAIGPAIERQLTTELLLEPEGALATWMARGATDPGRRLIAVCLGRPLRTQAPVERFGELQVVTYGAREPLARLEHLYRDLLSTLEGFPIDGDLTDHYGALMTLAQALGRKDELLRFTAYYYECFLRTKRQRDMPTRLLATRTTMTSQKILKSLLREATPAAPLPDAGHKRGTAPGGEAGE